MLCYSGLSPGPGNEGLGPFTCSCRVVLNWVPLSTWRTKSQVTVVIQGRLLVSLINLRPMTPPGIR
jgi:hypothetical protein